ncbi:MAG: hypothetical protein P4L48_09995 [Mycobacterium sp.]|nr:hypothetical protein [Mycobacterium sp.]
MTAGARESDPNEQSASDSSTTSVVEPESAAAKSESRSLSISLKALTLAAVIVALLAVAGVMTGLYFEERSKVQAQQQDIANRAHAEQIALDYAVNAAAMNYEDMNAWKAKLVSGTSDTLKDKLSKAATSMEQILVPLEWNSTSQPLTAKVRSETNGVYVVDTFVSVLTKTTQAPDNLQSTATYSITIDSHNNWLITDVGGIGAVVGRK